VGVPDDDQSPLRSNRKFTSGPGLSESAGLSGEEILPVKMKAAFYESKGLAEHVLRVGWMEVPDPGPGEVLIRMCVSGVNPTDCKMRTTGDMPFPRQVPGQDGAGWIEAVGSGVDPSRVGERVWVFHAAFRSPHGTAAEWTIVPADQAIGLPDHVTFEQGAGLGIPYMTAYRCLTDGGDIKGRRILATAGAGAVGNASIALGTWMGATMIATVSSSGKGDLALAAGASRVLNYWAPDFRDDLTSLGPFSRVIEVALGANIDATVDVLADRGVIVVYASEAQNPTVPVRSLMMKNATVEFVLVYGSTPHQVASAVEAITLFVEAGGTSPLPNHIYSLEEAVKAHEAVESGAVGKVLIRLRDG
jgi:NADPH2:quinone reductase